MLGHLPTDGCISLVMGSALQQGFYSLTPCPHFLAVVVLCGFRESLEAEKRKEVQLGFEQGWRQSKSVDMFTTAALKSNMGQGSVMWVTKKCFL